MVRWSKSLPLRVAHVAGATRAVRRIELFSGTRVLETNRRAPVSSRDFRLGSVDHGAPTIQAAAPPGVVSYVPVAKSTRRTLAIGSGRTSRPSFTNRIRRYFASSWREREIFGCDRPASVT